MLYSCPSEVSDADEEVVLRSSCSVPEGGGLLFSLSLNSLFMSATESGLLLAAPAADGCRSRFGLEV